MAPKIGIIEQLGESGLFLPELINRGLMARDKLKYYVSLLQAAHVYACLLYTSPSPRDS